MKTIIILAGLLFLMLPNGALAHVELINPQGGETFYSGDTVVIQWKQLATHDTQNWELYYSTDGGMNWEVISKNIGVSFREFAWLVPDEASTKAKIKVLMNNLSDQDYEDISPNFIIENTTSIFANNSQDALFASFNIFPNPSLSGSQITFEIEHGEWFSIYLFNTHGKQVGKVWERFYPSGSHNIPLSNKDLKPGIYFCVVKAGNASKTFKIQVLK